jgi:hypothetical protein
VSSEHETFTLSGAPIVQGKDDTYLYNHRNNDNPEDTQIKNQIRNHSPPVVGLITDTFWLFGYKKAAIYETTKTWNEVFQQNYPELYNQLLSEARIQDLLKSYSAHENARAA